MLVGEETLNLLDTLFWISRSRTYLHAITGGEDEPLGKAGKALKLLQVSIQVFLRKGDPLPELHRGRAVIESDENNLPHGSPEPFGIGMEPFLQEIDPQKGEQNCSESHNGHYSRLLPSPLHRQPLVQEGGVEQPGNEGPGFLRVPTPV